MEKRGSIGEFTPQQAAQLAKLPYSTLDFWNRSGFIRPSVQQSQGRGKLRLYSFTDVVALRVARELRDGGLSLQGLRKVISNLKGMGKDQPFAQTWLVTDGRTVYLKDETGLVDVLKHFGQRALHYVLDFSAAVEEIREKAAELKAA